MDALAVVEAAPDELHDVRDGLRRFVGIRFERERALRRLDDDDRTGVLAGRRQSRTRQQSTHTSSVSRHRRAEPRHRSPDDLVTPICGHHSRITHSPHRG